MKRIWFFGKGEWMGPLFVHIPDQYNHQTLGIRLPGRRAIAIANKDCTYCIHTARYYVEKPCSCCGAPDGYYPSGISTLPACSECDYGACKECR